VSRKFDSRFSRDILASCARDPSYRRRAVRVLGDHRFEDDHHQWLWTVMSSLAPGDLATGAVIAAAGRRSFPDLDDRRAVLETALDILKRAGEAPRAALDELERFRNFHAMHAGMERAVDLIDKGKVEDAMEALRKVSKPSGGIEYEALNWFDDFEVRQARRLHLREHPDQRLQVATRFMPSVDKALGGGIESGELGLIVATTGRGKSALAANIAFTAAGQGFNVVYISTEMSAELVATRLDARMLGLSYNAIKFHDHTDDDLEAIAAKMKRFRGRMANRLQVIGIPIRRARMAVVEEVLDEQEDAGRPTQLLILDSADHVTPSDRTLNRRDRETAAYWEAKSLADERGIPIWTTTHAPKDVVNKIATSENVGESYDKARIADLVFTLNQTKAQRVKGEMRGYLAKYRQGRGGFFVYLQADLARMHFQEAPPKEEPEEEEDDE
jgi:archaellum biogenesis ATPase FlaH